MPKLFAPLAALFKCTKFKTRKWTAITLKVVMTTTSTQKQLPHAKHTTGVQANTLRQLYIQWAHTVSKAIYTCKHNYDQPQQKLSDIWHSLRSKGHERWNGNYFSTALTVVKLGCRERVKIVHIWTSRGRRIWNLSKLFFCLDPAAVRSCMSLHLLRLH